MFQVEHGVHGAVRTAKRQFATLAEAETSAKRWAASNSQGSYWAEITEDGKLVTRFNLSTDLEGN